MECTQRLECTQDLYETHTEKICPEQIGFLGICGAKRPILKGPNKIGRDPQACSIVLNVNSVSRQHAVINILSKKEFMLMDLDSANKTKLLNITLQPYIPHPLKDGDTVQFGDIFGIFRLLEESDELPMTQAIDLPMTQPIDIPETPLPTKCISKLNKGLTTMIPESPDVSDKDDSFTTPTQMKQNKTRSSSGKFINSFGKSIPIHPISFKKDTSLNTSNRDTSENSSKLSISFIDQVDMTEPLESSDNAIVKNNQTKTQATINHVSNNRSVNGSTDSIYMADTQIPPPHFTSPSIHNLDTQIPIEHLPQVCKIDDQREMHMDIYSANKENDLSIFNADTQPFECQKDSKTEAKNTEADKKELSSSKPEGLNSRDDEILFDELEDECLEEFYSQPLLPQESPMRKGGEIKSFSKDNTSNKSNTSIDCDDLRLIPTQKVEELAVNEQSKNCKKGVESIALKRTKRIKSDSSTDCEDIELMPTQKVSELPVLKDITKEKQNAAVRMNRIDSDSSTDCEDIDIIPTQRVQEIKENGDDCSKVSYKDVGIDGEVGFEDMPTQVIDLDPEKINNSSFEDMNTQIVTIDDVKTSNNVCFEDQQTQIIEEITQNTSKDKVSLNDIISPFKVPLPTPLKVKNKETFKEKTSENKPLDPDNYYNATQDILEDLCTQRDGNSLLKESTNKLKGVRPLITDDDVVPCSVEGYETGDRFSNIDIDLSPIKANEEKNLKLPTVSSSTQDVRDIISIDNVTKPKNNLSSSSSDIESTPKKVKTCMFTDSDLPNSQEIEKNMMSRLTKQQTAASSSESDSEENPERQYTPLLHKKKKVKKVTKIDLTKKFDIEKLPERIITRIRKPTVKMEEALQNDKKASNMLIPKFLAGQDDQINEEIIKENVKRLKTYGRTKNNKEAKNDVKNVGDKNAELTISKTYTEDDVKDDRGLAETKMKGNELKEKIKVKIQKPKKKEIDTQSISKIESNTSKSSETSHATKGKKEASKKTEIGTKDKNLVSNTDEKLTARSTRTKRKETEVKSVEKNAVLTEDKKNEPAGTKRARSTRIKEQPSKSVSPEVEIRRSKRQVNVKEKKSDSQTMQPKSILKKNTHEQSTVYNISSLSGESPKNLKRPLEDANEVPSSKRTRSVVNNDNASITNVSLRATPARTMRKQYVLFTAFPCDEVKQKLEKLGAVIVKDVMECTVVLTMQIKRTFKLLCAVGLGRPIVGPSWVQACVDTHMIVDPWLYLIKDEQTEKRFQFALDRTLNGKRNFLKAYNVSSTPNVQPNSSEMKLIVECSGGTWKEGGSNWICLSCTKDEACWPALKKRGATVVSTEFILAGVLKQKIDINSNKFA